MRIIPYWETGIEPNIAILLTVIRI